MLISNARRVTVSRAEGSTLFLPNPDPARNRCGLDFAAHDGCATEYSFRYRLRI
jgi:hypothetical protein